LIKASKEIAKKMRNCSDGQQDSCTLFWYNLRNLNFKFTFLIIYFKDGVENSMENGKEREFTQQAEQVSRNFNLSSNYSIMVIDSGFCD